jgi:predicted solute-binding protein
MFYVIAKKIIDLGGYRFEHRFENIQTLNERARRGELQISAISIHAHVYVAATTRCCPAEQVWGTYMDPDRQKTSNVEHRKSSIDTENRDLVSLRNVPK